MGSDKDRRALAQQLRVVARRQGGPVVADAAGRAKVEVMYQSTLKSPGLTAADRATIQRAFTCYMGTFTSQSLPGPSQGASVEVHGGAVHLQLNRW